MEDISKYYYEQAGQQVGPVAANQLIVQGVTASTLVWSAKMVDWAAAGTVPELRDLFSPPSPIPAQPAASASAQPVKPTRLGMPPPAPARSVFTKRNLLMGLVVLVAIGAEVASRAEPDAAEPETIEQTSGAPTQEEVKEIGYAAKHMHDEDAANEESAKANPAASPPTSADAIEDVDNDDGWLTIHYERGDSRNLGVEKDWLFAYSPQLLVTHNDRVSCQVRDIYGNQITSGSTLNDGTCTGLRVVGDHIIIDVDTGHNTHQETYDEKLHLLRRSNVQMY